MSADVVELDCITWLDIPVERVLRKAMEAGLTDVVVIGFDADGDEYFAASSPDGGNTLWHLERTKWRLMRASDKMTGDEP